ncbi:MAG: hypothetical protein D6820_15160, partial [Lentisphaerae bacterium]
KHGVKRIKLPCKTWRGEYWLKKMGIDEVNPKVFPNGYEDLAAYTDYVHKHGGIVLAHNVSLHVGFQDPRYITGEIDRRLDAWWGHGQLEKPISATDTTIYYRPGPERRLPTKSKKYMVWFKPGKIILTWDVMRIGNELILVGEFQDLDKPVWRLTKCKRGLGSTEAVAHPKGERGAGIWRAYRKVIVPPYDVGRPDSLMKELAMRYANLVNKTGLDNLHFDGIEIHRTNPVCDEIAMDLAYQQIKHVVTVGQVGGSSISSFELKFHRVTPHAYRTIKIPLRLEKKTPKALRKGSWLASDRIAPHFSVVNCILYGSRVLDVSSPIGGEGIDLETIRKHGLTEEMFALMQAWSALLPHLTPADFAYMQKVVQRKQGGHHHYSEDIPVLINENGTYKFQLYRIMGRVNGKDGPTHFIQEGGVTERKQTIHAGESMVLLNPYESQPPLIYLRVTEKNRQGLVNPRMDVGDGYSEIAVTVPPSHYLVYDGAKTTAELYDRNWNLLKKAAVTKRHFIMPKGQARVRVANKAGTRRNERIELQVQFITKGPKYTLEANRGLRQEDRRINLRRP